MQRSWFSRTISSALVALAMIPAVATVTGQEAKPAIDLARIAGDWTMYPRGEEATPPPPPPVYASQRQVVKQPPFESVPRVILRFTGGELSGEAVFPEGIVLTELNADVSDRFSTPLENLRFDGNKLSFEAKVDNQTLLAEAEWSRNRFLGRWRLADGSQKGKLFLVRLND